MIIRYIIGNRRKNCPNPRNYSTIEFLGIWERINNPYFKGVEFDSFKKDAGANSFTLSPQLWIQKTGAVGLISRSGNGGGTFAHKDIAFEFATWISAEFKLYFIKEFQRLKIEENERLTLSLIMANSPQLECSKVLKRRDIYSISTASI